MKLIDRQLVLPVVISLSLTGVGAALLYFLYKKDGESKETNTTRVSSFRQHEIQVRVPRQFVPAIIGRSGNTIKDIQDKTDTRINFSAEEPDVLTRICHIRGKQQCTHLAQLMIENIIANQPIIETYETYIPQQACAKIIGRGGDVIRNIQAISSAKVIVESSRNYTNPDAKTRVIIKGTAEHIAAALAMIEEKVLEQNNIRKQLDVSSSSRLPRGQVSPRNSTVHLSDNQSESKDASTATEGLVEVFVSAMDSPSQFWVQVVGSGSVALDKLVDEMTAYYNDEANIELHTLKKASVGQMVAAKFSVDEKWYRAEVVSELKDGRYEVYFVDYGDNQALALQDLMELRTDFLSLRLQAVECSLANVKPRDGEWCPKACDKFAELSWVAQWKSLTAKVRGYKERSLARGSSRREGSPIPCIDLYDKTDHRDINIGKELVAAAIAEEEEISWSAASSTLSLTQRSSRESPTTLISRLSAVSPPLPSDISPPKNVATLSTEADVAKPKKTEMGDTATPVRTTPLLQKEQRNGSGDHFRNGSNTIDKIINADKEGPSRRIVQPAGYESDFTDDSDSLEIQ